jgi:hypothetical protein
MAPSGAAGGAERSGIMVLPAAAVLSSPAGPYALVVVGDAVAARPIVTGRAFVDFVPVIAGLAADERVIVRGAALFDAQRRLAVAAEMRP